MNKISFFYLTLMNKNLHHVYSPQILVYINTTVCGLFFQILFL